MHLEISTRIESPRDAVWAVLVDVERWPEWTASVRRVERLDTGDLRVGSRARVKQPGQPTMEWRVTEVQPGRGFTWESRTPGITTVGTHRVEAVDGATRVVLGIEQTGALAGITRLLFGRRTRRYVHTEAEGLRRRVETSATA